ncbi:MAG: hypothetical protein D6802_03905 [Ardenticatenia bacterium]|nr:MAG: hypothetical protein D6802_03905 [Ardenticatenia bacterium]
MLSRHVAFLTRWIDRLALVWVVLWGVWQSTHLHAYAFDFDEGVHLMQARLIAKGAHPYHDIGLLLPPVWFETTAALFRLFGATVLVGRLPVVVMACVGAVLTWGLARRFGAAAGLMGAMAFTLVPQGLWLSRAMMLEVPAVVFALAALFIASRAETSASRWFVAGFLFGLSLMTKAVVPATFAALVWLAWQSPQRVRALTALTTGVILLVGATFTAYDAAEMWRLTVAVRSAMREAFPWHPLHNVQRILSDGLLPIGGLVVLACLGARVYRRVPLVQALALWGIATLGLLFWHTPLRGQHLYTLGVIAAPLAAAGSAWLSQRLASPRWGVGLFIIALVWQLGLTWSQIAPTYNAAYKFDDGKARLAAYIAATTAPTDTVVVDYPMIAFRAGRSSVPALAEISDGRIASGYLTSEMAIAATEQAKPALIAFWSGRLQKLEAYTTWVETHYIFDRYFGRSHPVYRRAPNE